MTPIVFIPGDKIMKTFNEWKHFAKEDTGITYLGCPYSHPDPKIKEQRFKEICRIAAALMCNGYILFVPIAMCHPMARDYGLPGDFQFWKNLDTAFIDASDRMLIVKMKGWEDSKGLTEEQDIAKNLNIPVYFMEPTDV